MKGTVSATKYTDIQDNYSEKTSGNNDLDNNDLNPIKHLLDALESWF